MKLLFLTDNSMEEAVYYQGNSSDKDISELILWLVYSDLWGCFIFQIIWLSGTIQIASGIDGFSGGCLTDRIASSDYI